MFFMKLALLLLSVFFHLFWSPANAAQPCNSNKNCKLTWICVGGTADNGPRNFTGTCKPNLVTKQICYFHGILSGQFGKMLTVLAVASLSVGFFAGKIEWPALITLAFGAAFVLASISIVNLVTNSRGSLCDFRGVE